MDLQGAKYEWSRDPANPGLVKEIARGAGVSDLLATVLVSRKIGSAAEATAFLRGGADALPDARLLPDADRVIERIAAAVAGDQSVAVHGHDDADGVCATVIMVEALRQLGASVCSYIPDRRTEGHGLNRVEIDHLAATGVALVVTVDSCVSDRDHVAYAASLGIDTIITDHHEIPPALPPAHAIVNPKLADSAYPYRYMAGVGVALRVGELIVAEIPSAIAGAADRPWYGPRWFDEAFALAAIGSIADRVPLTGDNRTIVVEGLGAAGRTERPGLRALLEESRLWGAEIGPDDIRESLAPIFGRVSDGRGTNEAYEILTGTDIDEARARARVLAAARSRWRDGATQAWQRAQTAIDQQVAADDPAAVVELAIPVEVVGYVASRLADGLGKPTVVIARRDGTSMGEGRGPRGFNLVTAFSSMADLFVGYGGHPRAAGFSIRNENVPAFRRRMLEYVADNPPEARRRPIDAELPLSGVTPAVAGELETLRPYGPGNGPAVLFASGVTEECVRRARARGVCFGTPMVRLRSPVCLVYRLSRTDGVAFIHVLDKIEDVRA